MTTSLLLNATDATSVATPTVGDRLLVAARRLSAARTPGAAATALNAALDAATAYVERTVCLFVPSWPTADVDVDTLTADAMMEVASRFPDAPRTTSTAIMAWLSATVFDTLYAQYIAARYDARNERALATSDDAATSLLLSDEDALTNEDTDPTYVPRAEPVPDVTALQAHRLQRVLARMMARDAQLLSLRAAGTPMREIGRMLGVTARTAGRLHARALSAARRIADELYDDAA